MKLIKTISLTLAVFVLLSGCMYPNERRAEYQIPYPDQLEMVQNAIQQFQEKTGVLPIVTKETDTPLYEKYVIDFNQLIPRYLSRVPVNAFEEGGVYQYVLVDVEDDPKVRLIDLRLSKAVGSLQLRLNEYMREYTYLPVDEVLENGYFTLDYSKLNLKNPPQVASPFSKTYLPFIVSQQGVIGIDYSIDLYPKIKSVDNLSIDEEVDIRSLLVEDSVFVPVASFPYVIKNGEPVLKKMDVKKN